MSSDFIVVTTTFANQADANRLAKIIIESRLAACAQVEGPITSCYWWKDTVETEEEWKCSFKSAIERYKSLETAIKQQHPYENPEIVALPILAGSSEYLNWLKTEIGSADKT